MSHSHVYSPTNYAFSDSWRVIKPHQLIAELVRHTGKSTLQVAKEMHSPSFQGTLHKYINGLVPNPSRPTAAKIAKYFDLPVDAVYDQAQATKAAKDRGIALPSKAWGVAEPTAIYNAALRSKKLTPATEQRIQALDDDQLKGLEAVVLAYLDAVAPRGRAKNTGT